MIDAIRELPSGVRRALARADAGKTLTVEEATLLGSVRGPALAALTGTAARIRDQAFGDRVTHSRKVFIPLTHLCRDICGYGTFAWPPKGDIPAFVSVEQVVDISRAGRRVGCREALFTLGPSARNCWRWLSPVIPDHVNPEYAARAGRTPAERTTDYTRIKPGGIRYRFDSSPAPRERPIASRPLPPAPSAGCR